MRIISGEYKSRKIYSAPSSKELRPSSDRTRETLFNILTHRIVLHHLTCLDLFSGTGAYGFEALSRGAANCSFVDISSIALGFISKTSQALACSSQIKFVKADAVEFLRSNADEDYDLIFADPPYDYGDYSELIRLVLKRNFKVFVLECSKHTLKQLPDYRNPDRFSIIDKIIGTTCSKIFISNH